jgi:hypothetical protein
MRLKQILPKLIDPAQAAFVPKRWIAENVVLAQEVIHSFNQSKRKKGNVRFKLDFKKAYYSLEWDFILAVLKVVGFDQKIVNLIYQYISTVQYTLLLNGTKSSTILPSRVASGRSPISVPFYSVC